MLDHCHESWTSKAVLLRPAELIRAHGEELALPGSLDTGKLVTDAISVDVPGAAGIWAWTAEALDKLDDEVAPTGPGDLALVRRVPVGVVGAVTPWNLPPDMATWTCSPALAAGNSVVLKPAEQSPLSALRLAELAAEAGPHMDVDCLAFTGSTATGKLFKEHSGRWNLKTVWPETGDKSPNLVFADAHHLGRAADMAAFGIFFNGREVCSASSRLYVERSIRDEVLDRLMARAERAQPGDPLDPASRMGAIVDERQTERTMGFVEAGRATARLVTEGERLRVNGRGCFVQPTIFDEVRPEDPPRARRSSARPCRRSPSTGKRRRCAWPTTRSQASRPRSGPTTCPARCAWPTRSMSARRRSTPWARCRPRPPSTA